MARFIPFRTPSGSTLVANADLISRYYADGNHTVIVFGPDGDSSRVAESISAVTEKLKAK